MNHDYRDIRNRIPEETRWWDEYAVPRYCEFSPDAVADIYADEAALVGIACQGCGCLFDVAFSKSALTDGGSLAEAINNHTIHYGDPPNIGCCGAGPTMNSEPLRVLEYWHRHHQEFTREADPAHPGLRIVTSGDYFAWRRDPKLEIPIWAAAEQPKP